MKTRRTPHFFLPLAERPLSLLSTRTGAPRLAASLLAVDVLVVELGKHRLNVRLRDQLKIPDQSRQFTPFQFVMYRRARFAERPLKGRDA